MNAEDFKNDETEKTALSTKFKNAYRDIVSRNKNINS